jgi:acyl-CoA hydrolase
VGDLLNSVEACVDRAIAVVGKQLVLGAPLGLGKPVQLMNAFFRRAAADPSLSLHIYTALSLEVPTPTSHIEAGLAGPIMQRLFGDYEELDYMKALRANRLPTNIQVSELYFKAGSMKGIASAQQGYISSNYTHIARDICDLGVNVLVQMVAARETVAGLEVSLSSNPDTGLDVARRLRAEDRPAIGIGQIHPDMPFMENDAQVDEDFFDLLVRNPEYDKTLFAVPNAAVPLADYATAIHASSLVPDGGTLQIGIGSLGDAVAHALILRHKHPHAYAEMLQELTAQTVPLAEAPAPFSHGLYVSTEMFVNGMMHLMEQGIVKRKVYDDLVIQRGLNDGLITEQVDAALFEYGMQAALIPPVLDERSLKRLQYWGILPETLSLSGEGLQLADDSYPNQLKDASLLAALLDVQQGRVLRHGKILHGGFFLGPRDFYNKLSGLDEEGQDSICMTSVLRTNQLLEDYPLYCEQRTAARFINTGMMVTLTGAVASDALEDGTVISGVGGQYNFVAMAQDLPGAHSVLCIRSTRGSGKQVQSNIVPHYGHITIPKHLRDVVVTEYGVAELRGQSDSNINTRLINIADSRFQDELLVYGKQNGKVETEYEIPAFARNNTPSKLGQALKPKYRQGLLMDYPFGTELTDQEIALAASLRKIKALSDDPAQFIPAIFRALFRHPDEDQAKPFLERLDLLHPGTPKDFIVQQLLMLELEEQGLLTAG